MDGRKRGFRNSSMNRSQAAVTRALSASENAALGLSGLRMAHNRLSLSMITETGPRIFTEKGPLFGCARTTAIAPAELAGVAQPGRSRVGEARIVWRGQARFLKRQLSLPVSTMSQ